MSLRPPTGQQWGWERRALVLLLITGWWLRICPISDNRLHADEAWYSYWGLLIGRGIDPWLTHVPLDKPPLLPYLLALSEWLAGRAGGWPGDGLAVRLPGLITGLLSIPLTAALASSLYRSSRVMLLAALGVALSPLAILFSATAFTDPPMVASGLAACVAAARGRPGWAGLWCGLACAAKQSGVLWLPLAALIWVVQEKHNLTWRKFGRMLIALAVVTGIIGAWDVARVAQGAVSFWQAGIQGYGGLRLIWPQELSTRLYRWLVLMRYIFVSPVVNTLLLAGLPALVSRALCAPRSSEAGLYTREALADISLTCFALLYFLFLWLRAFQVWDRYVLPLMPLLAILLGRILSVLGADRIPLLIILLLLILMSQPAWNAAHSLYPIGGDHGAYDGIDVIAAFLRSQPEGTVVYHHWLGWHYSFYLFGAPLYLAYWPTPAWLAQDVRAFGAQGGRFIAFPSWESSARVEHALTRAGYKLVPVLATTRRDGTRSFTLYRLQPLSERGIR